MSFKLLQIPPQAHPFDARSAALDGTGWRHGGKRISEFMAGRSRFGSVAAAP